MKGLRRHPFRVLGRLLWFAGEIIIALFDFLIHCAFRPKKSALAARALWLQRASRRSLRIVKFKTQVAGPVPSGGLLVSNHLSYLDVPVMASLTPAVFVAKHEIKSWPVIGWLARLAGTLFIDRERRMDVALVNAAIQTALDGGALVVVFPEGTSSDGQTVLPFKSSLLEPATRQIHSLSISLIEYELEDGDAGKDVCYWGDVTFFSHLLNLLSKRTFRASVRFALIQSIDTSRKELAQQLHSEMLKLKNAATGSKNPSPPATGHL
jgi:1-acyl-sn-glycerol-3-phosphate acyltransferase